MLKTEVSLTSWTVSFTQKFLCSYSWGFLYFERGSSTPTKGTTYEHWRKGRLGQWPATYQKREISRRKSQVRTASMAAKRILATVTSQNRTL